MLVNLLYKKCRTLYQIYQYYGTKLNSTTVNEGVYVDINFLQLNILIPFRECRSQDLLQSASLKPTHLSVVWLTLTIYLREFWPRFSFSPLSMTPRGQTSVKPRTRRHIIATLMLVCPLWYSTFHSTAMDAHSIQLQE